jgi:uncharacterized membrane protein YdcZ (DUF606 family)
MVINDYLSVEKLFETIPAIPGKVELWSVLAFFAIVTLISIAAFFLKRDKLVFFKKQNGYFLSIGVTGLIHIFSRNQALPWLGSRWVLVLLLLALLCFVGISLYLTLTNIPKLESKKAIEDKYRQYLPKQKGKI